MTALLPSTPMLLAFVGASLVTLAVPGPSVVYVVARSIEQGRRAGLCSVLGLETGASLHVLAATVGLATLLASSEAALTATRVAGGGYLIWLASREFRKTRDALLRGSAAAYDAGPLRTYLDGVLIDLLNPKTALFFLAFLPQFVDPSKAAAPQFAGLGALFVGLAALVDSGYAVLASRLSERLRSSPRAQHHLRRATGGVYLTLGAVSAIA
ncbi:threonine/homoserine/homoserine lactone efflux protein [Haloactinopolyspora alba]|uniref:Threonine/homoserine/homoserine lactone efflux protein n=1 Tax=Haloactinopolyspora alba TaxID=648780 RepID=A0A2P8E537_9ACTN|nr:LysE family translocator [Haloactinopolyspora alba]PSL04580.1 threonine/homoserine/homoserine lactone efflux protein [Haloactinopolyspora alba]